MFRKSSLGFGLLCVSVSLWLALPVSSTEPIALPDTKPLTEEGKKQSRQNAVRHGLTAETVIDALEDAEDYAAFEMAVTADYDDQSAVERELVLRLASVLRRLRRAH